MKTTCVKQSVMANGSTPRGIPGTAAVAPRSVQTPKVASTVSVLVILPRAFSGCQLHLSLTARPLEVVLEFSCAIDPQSFNSDTIRLHGQAGIAVEFNIPSPFTQPSFAPTRPLLAGERLEITTTTGLRDSQGQSVPPATWWLIARPDTGTAIFNVQTLNSTAEAVDVALGDLDADGDLDAFIAAKNGTPNEVWLNDGAGTLTHSGQSLGGASSLAVALGDLDGDGDLDALIVNEGFDNSGDPAAPNAIWFNNGAGVFSNSGQSLGLDMSAAVALGDLDSDGDLDAFIANADQPDRVWFNNGQGVFDSSGQGVGLTESSDVALGDLDADGDLDAFVTYMGRDDMVWFNNGQGFFSQPVRIMPSMTLESEAVELGDLNGDGALDAFVSRGQDGNLLLFNDGDGLFSTQTIPFPNSDGPAKLGDFNADGLLDIFIDEPNYLIKINQGDGTFSNTEIITFWPNRGRALGDLNGDGSLDIFMIDDTDHHLSILNAP